VTEQNKKREGDRHAKRWRKLWQQNEKTCQEKDDERQERQEVVCTPEMYSQMQQTANRMPTVPYRPLKAGEARLNRDFSRSTELTMTMPVGSGFSQQFVNIPSLYMTGDGIMQASSPTQAMNMALGYEAGTGRRFPRYSTLTGALGSAGARSSYGGVMSGSLAR